MKEQSKERHYPIYSLFSTKGWLWIAFLAIAATFAAALATNSYNKVLRDTCGSGIIAMELASKASTAEEIIRTWKTSPTAKGQISCFTAAEKLQKWDWLLIAAYSCCLFACFAAIGHLVGLQPAETSKFIFLLPFIAAGFDIVENIFMYIIMKNPEDISGLAVQLMSAAAVFKFSLLLVMMFILAYLFGCWLMSRSSRREEAANLLCSLDEVVEEERKYLQFRRIKAKVDINQPLTGLASSGGGIRSATVNLGIIERMLDVNIFRQMDYHSTVSGGGYIGSAVASLLSFKEKTGEQEFPQGCGPKEMLIAKKAQYQFGEDDRPHFDCANPGLRPFPVSEPGFPNDEPNHLPREMVLSHLRSFGDFLIRRRRVFSRDVLRAAGTVLTGMAATLAMFLFTAMLCSAVAFSMLTLVDQGQESLRLGFKLDRDLSYFKDFALFGWKKSIFLGFLSALILLKLPTWLPSSISRDTFTRDGDTCDDCRQYRGLWIIGTILAFSAFIFPHHLPGKVGVLTPAAFLAGAAVTAVVTYLLLCLTDDAFRFWSLPDEPTRENRSMLSAMVGLTLAMTAFATLLGLLPWLVLHLLSPTGKIDQAVDALGSTSIAGLFSAILAGLVTWYRKAAPAKEEKKDLSEGFRLIKIALAYAKGAILALPILFLVAIVAVISSAWVAWLAYNTGFLGHGFIKFSFISAVFAAMLMVIGYAVDFNKLSLHYFYRDRLAEAYLTTYGADPEQPWSLEVKRDNIEMKLTDLHGSCSDAAAKSSSTPESAIPLRFQVPSESSEHASKVLTQALENSFFTSELISSLPVIKTYKKRLGIGSIVKTEYVSDAATSAPYHLYCTCLNLTTDRNMSLRTRKSDIFVFSKLFCGSKTTSFLPTRSYRRGATKVARAMTISGAAVDSSLGRNTFFAQSFATTLFNVRLGQWLENPGYKGGRHANKQEDLIFWPNYLLMEALGMSDSRRRLVHLSDGGHTGDNLGILPLFDRKCGLIIAVDAEADPEYRFASLRTALSYLQTDGKTRIRLDLRPITPDPETGFCQAPFVLGEIEYLDKFQNVSSRGCLIVLKSAVTKEMPLLIRKHKEQFPEFPQETTADQFFSEDQFEAYRHLGREIADCLFRALPSLAEGNIDNDLLVKEYAAWLESLQPVEQ